MREEVRAVSAVAGLMTAVATNFGGKTIPRSRSPVIRKRRFVSSVLRIKTNSSSFVLEFSFFSSGFLERRIKKKSCSFFLDDEELIS